MAIREIRPHRTQFFADVRTNADVPTRDVDAWQLNPEHRWVYDKLAIARSEGIAAGPHGTVPPHFPIFSKPITNLNGMGAGSRALHTLAEYKASYAAGHMWVTLAEGEHVSSDIAVVEGEPCWWRHSTGRPAGQGTFDYWTVHAAPKTDVEARCGAWVRRHLMGYTGMLNLETIGGSIIEAHLRFSAQWPDLYGAGWVEALVRLYDRKRWTFADTDRRDGYSVVLFVPFGDAHRHPSHPLVEEVKALLGVASVQISFNENEILASHAMPPGGFRVAIINGFDLDGAMAGRERLRQHFLKSDAAAASEAKRAHANVEHLSTRQLSRKPRTRLLSERRRGLAWPTCRASP